MESIISKEHLEKTLENISKVRKTGSNIELTRAGGFLEGILYSLGKLSPMGDFPYRDIEYIEIGWFGKEKVRTRQQTYLEYMIERVEELMKTL